MCLRSVEVHLELVQVAVTGSSGFIGSHLVPHLEASGNVVLRVVRRRTEVENEIFWDPATGEIDAQAFEGLDGVVNLAGENISLGRWTKRKKSRIIGSRVGGTGLLASTLAKLDGPPGVFLSASGVCYAGRDLGDDLITEDCPPGEGNLLVPITHQWEAAAQPAIDAGIRVAFLRWGLVVHPAGGLLKKMVLPFKLCLGGRTGNGRQWMSWCSMEDAVGAIEHLLRNPKASGPIHMTTPHPVRNRELTKCLAKELHRPAVLHAPRFLLRLIFGPLANETIFLSNRATPQKLVELGYQFLDPHLRPVLHRYFSKSSG